MAGPEPALEQARWIGLWARLGAEGSGVPQFERLRSAYAEPIRFYHTAAHIRDCLTQFDGSRELANEPDLVETAIWFHDAVYVPGAPNNEERSAQLAETELVTGALSPEIGHRVARLVRATTHRSPSEEPDAQLLCDIDLSILGREPDVYDDFERKIRREYALIPEPLYQTGRSAVLQEFLARPHIYATDRFRSRYERQARLNLGRALAQLAGPG